MSGVSGNLDASANKSTADWLESARHGSREAMGKLLEACRGYLLLVANRELATDLRAKGGASDLVQDTFLEGHRNFRRFKGDTEAELLAWLRCILLNHLANFDRRYRRTAKRKIASERPLESTRRRCDGGDVLVAATPPSPSWQAAAREEAEALDLAVARLPLDYGRIIVLVHRENLSFAEAAQEMNRSVDSARRLWARAVELLADELDGTHECR
jgi:RNA polymerase sigma-70 factor, ECF subfamily